MGMFNFLLSSRNKWRKLGAHLEEHGVRAPATVVDIAKWGSDHSRTASMLENEALHRLPGDSLAPSNTGEYYIRKTKLRIRPAEEPEFEMEGKIRYGDFGLDIPKAGDEIAVVYDPNDHSKVMVAPPTAEQEAIRTANALGKAKIGFQVGGGGAKAGASEPITEEDLAQRVEGMDQSMDQMQSMLQQAQQFMGGQTPSGQTPGSGPTDDTVAQLERLQSLKDSGALSEAEFEAEKKKLLG